jgi:hypothetical protein
MGPARMNSQPRRGKQPSSLGKSPPARVPERTPSRPQAVASRPHATCRSFCRVSSMHHPDPLRHCGVEAQLTPLGSPFRHLLLAFALGQPPHQAPRSASTRHATAPGYGSCREHATLLLERATSPTSYQTRCHPEVTSCHRLQPPLRPSMSTGHSGHPPAQLASPRGPRTHQPPPQPVTPFLHRLSSRTLVSTPTSIASL